MRCGDVHAGTGGASAARAAEGDKSRMAKHLKSRVSNMTGFTLRDILMPFDECVPTPPARPLPTF